MNVNRRESTRTPVEGTDAFGEIVCEGRRIPILIINESTGGLGVVAVNVPQLESGAKVRFVSKVRAADSRVGSLRYVRVADADICRIGLEWTD